eukprot:TRINITY_DN6546_c0_g1_i3.p1 TRINITY_DN6546_c0_g1~~TRINITY_DN6546_c0_g1_i3.p1  ORF type:complete len:931 (+),score=129.60 TRINITY_DN6546_c0_g1_i3:75-2867(+)
MGAICSAEQQPASKTAKIARPISVKRHIPAKEEPALIVDAIIPDSHAQLSDVDSDVANSSEPVVVTFAATVNPPAISAEELPATIAPCSDSDSDEDATFAPPLARVCRCATVSEVSSQPILAASLQSISAARAEMSASLASVSYVRDCGVIVPYGQRSFAVAVDDEYLPLIAAYESGCEAQNVRIVVFGHERFLSDTDGCHSVADTAKFVTQAIVWAARTCSLRALLIDAPKSYALNLADMLSSCATCVTRTHSDLSAVDSNACDVIVCLAQWIDCAAKATILEEYLRSGGGLIIAGSGPMVQRQLRMPAHELVVNKFLSQFGLLLSGRSTAPVLTTQLMIAAPIDHARTNALLAIPYACDSAASPAHRAELFESARRLLYWELTDPLWITALHLEQVRAQLLYSIGVRYAMHVQVRTGGVAFLEDLPSALSDIFLRLKFAVPPRFEFRDLNSGLNRTSLHMKQVYAVTDGHVASLLLFSDKAVPLAVGSDESVAVAGSEGPNDSRVVVFGHAAYVAQQDCGVLFAYETMRLLIASIVWTSKVACPRVLVIALPHLLHYLRLAGFTNVRQYDEILTVSKAQFDCVVACIEPSLVAATACDRLKQFLAEGGGAVIAGNVDTWLKKGRSVTQHPCNGALAVCGIAISSQYCQPLAQAVFKIPSRQHIVGLPRLVSALNSVANRSESALHGTQQNDLLKRLRNLSVLTKCTIPAPASTMMRTLLKGNWSSRDLSFMAGQNLSAVRRARLALASFEQLCGGLDLPKHPQAFVPQISPSPTSLAVTFPVRDVGYWCCTQLYAHPGVLTTLQFDNLHNGHFIVRIGFDEDINGSSWLDDRLMSWPHVTSFEVVADNVCDVRAPHGGCIYVWVPPLNVASVSCAVSNAVDCKCLRAANELPLDTFSGRNVVLTIDQASLRDLSDIDVRVVRASSSQN